MNTDSYDRTPTPRRRIRQTLEIVFLVFGPLVYLWSGWSEPPGGLAAVIAASVLFWLVYFRALAALTARKLGRALYKNERDYSGEVDALYLHRLRDHFTRQHDALTTDQLRHFAISILAPRAIRTRTTDRYTPEHRTVTKAVSLELLLPPDPPGAIDPHSPRSGAVRAVLGRWLPNARASRSEQRRAAAEDDTAHTSALNSFVALTLPPKGRLYDDLVAVDGSGSAVPVLAQSEYRILVAELIRTLLIAAFGGRVPLPDAALHAEHDALVEIIRFPNTQRRSGETRAAYGARRAGHESAQAKAVARVMALADFGADRDYLRLTAEMINKLSTNYAIVAAIPRGSNPRTVVTYTRRIIPELVIQSWRSLQGIRDRLSLFLGARPFFLTVDARNATLCQSYHLLVTSPPDQYVADFDARCVTDSDDARMARLEPYWHIRGRRGQRYFHLYTRGFSTPADSQGLNVKVAFFEVPPGSLARAALAAVASLVVSLAVGPLVSLPALPGQFDTEIAVFLLAVPGIAAAWLGSDSRSENLFESALASRVSLFATFALSLTASVLLLLDVAQVLPGEQIRVYEVYQANIWWTSVASLTFVNAAFICYTWWVRSTYYRQIATKPVGNGGSRHGEP